MVCRYMAGAANLPFFPIRTYYESDIPKVNPKIVPMTSRTATTRCTSSRRCKPDVAIVHAQRADATATRRSGGSSGVRRRRRSRPTA